MVKVQGRDVQWVTCSLGICRIPNVCPRLPVHIRELDDFLQQQNISANQNNKKVEVTYGKGRRGDRITGDVEPEPEPEKKKIETKTKTVADRRLQKIRIAAKKTARTGVKTAKYLKKNPFATLVGASMAKDTFFPAVLPKPPTVQGGKVGRRTAG